MYRVYGFQLGPNFKVQLTAEKNICLRLTVDKMHAFADFTEKYLRPYGFNGTNFTASVNCTNPKFIETQIMGMQIYFIVKKCFFLLVANLLIRS